MSARKGPGRAGVRATLAAVALPGAALTALGLLGAPAAAQAPPEPGAAAAPEIVTTRHRTLQDGRPLEYTARAGFLPIRDNESGELQARIFFMAYTVEPAPGSAPRPLAFLWNGGPGMNSSLIHLLGFGPRRVRTADTYPESVPLRGTELEDNSGTWLDRMDLVFVDPVGTGYSRPARPEHGVDFYQTPGDAEAMAELIRVYRVRFEAWDQPLFIVGHSYGTTRAMALSAILERRRIPLAGVVLMSGGIQVGQPDLAPEVSTALAVPGMTAAAHWHRRLAPDLQGELDDALEEARVWALESYAPALARAGSLSPAETDAALRGLARYTGLDPSVLDPATLTVERDHFKTSLLPGRILGNYDYRMTRSADSSAVDSDLFPTLFGDPSFQPAVPLVEGTSPLLNRYLRHELGFATDLLYQGPLLAGYPPGVSTNRRFNRDPAGERLPSDPGEGEEAPPLRRAMDANPALRVFLLRGLYDSLGAGCARHVHTVERLEPALRPRVEVACYGAGHDFYTDRDVRRRIRADVAAFVERTLAGAGAGTR